MHFVTFCCVSLHAWCLVFRRCLSVRFRVPMIITKVLAFLLLSFHFVLRRGLVSLSVLSLSSGPVCMTYFLVRRYDRAIQGLQIGSMRDQRVECNEIAAARRHLGQCCGIRVECMRMWRSGELSSSPGLASLLPCDDPLAAQTVATLAPSCM